MQHSINAVNTLYCVVLLKRNPYSNAIKAVAFYADVFKDFKVSKAMFAIELPLETTKMQTVMQLAQKLQKQVNAANIVFNKIKYDFKFAVM